SIRPSAPPSAGVTDGQRKRSRARATGSMGYCTFQSGEKRASNRLGLLSPPLAQERWGGRLLLCGASAQTTTPTPNPSPQGGGEHAEYVEPLCANLIERGLIHRRALPAARRPAAWPGGCSGLAPSPGSGMHLRSPRRS